METLQQRAGLGIAWSVVFTFSSQFCEQSVLLLPPPAEIVPVNVVQFTANMEEALLSRNWDALTAICEVTELQKQGKTPSSVYSALLAVYLLQRNTDNAKLLWKRIPADTKKGDATLGRVWTVGQHLWRRNFAEAQKCLAESWPEYVSPIMTEMAKVVQGRVVQLISRAYSNVSLQSVAEMLGCTPEVALRLVNELGWSVNGASVIPLKPQAEGSEVIDSDKHMEMLTSYISMLENWPLTHTLLKVFFFFLQSSSHRNFALASYNQRTCSCTQKAYK